MDWRKILKNKTYPQYPQNPQNPQYSEMQNNLTNIADNADKKETKKALEKPASSYGKRIEIKPMTNCLHNQACEFLDAPGEKRPKCKESGKPVFDMRRCPLKFWWFDKGAAKP